MKYFLAIVGLLGVILTAPLIILHMTQGDMTGAMVWTIALAINLVSGLFWTGVIRDSRDV